METQIIFNLILLSWGLLFVVMLLCSKKYGAYRREALSIMKKTRVIAYCIPFILCTLVTAIFYNVLTDHYGTGAVWFWVLTLGVLIGIIMFDAFESSNVERSATERKLETHPPV